MQRNITEEIEQDIIPIEKEINDKEEQINLIQKKLESKKLVIKYAKSLLKSINDLDERVRIFRDDNSRSNMNFDILLYESKKYCGNTVQDFQRHFN